MKAKPFAFKQFELMQSDQVMKITTDSVLFGAWIAEYDAKEVLDIGTGTGILAMMMAQKNELARVTAIDVNANAVQLALQNSQASQYADRVEVQHVSLQSVDDSKQFDLIVSNPPYFINDLKAKKVHHILAKHTVELSYEALLQHANRLLTDNGRLYLIVPYFNVDSLLSAASAAQLFLTRQMNVIAVEGKVPYLALLKLERANTQLINKTAIAVKCQQGNYTNDFKALTKQFYKMF